MNATEKRHTREHKADPAIAGTAVVLMDVQMPEMDGFECTSKIRDKEQVTRVHLPVVAMTVMP